MMFDHPIMLAGLGGAVIPLVLHLLGRARYRSVEWGAMMFLSESAPRLALRAGVKEGVLLAVRMAMVGLLAVALARPVIRAPDVPGEGRVTAAIVLDRSASMAIEDNGVGRMQAARAAVVRILGGLHRGDQVCLLPTGQSAAARAELAATSDLQSVANRISDIRPANQPADFAEALSAAWRVLEKYPKTQRRLYVVCDRQASSWRRVDDAFAADWRDRTGAALSERVIVPVGGNESDNVAIESVALVDPPAVQQTAADVIVTVRNYGDAPADAVPLTVRSGGKQVHAATLRLAAGGSTSTRFSMHFDSPADGVQSVVAQVRAPGLASDDRYEALLNVVAPIRTLIASGGDAAFVRAALAPYAALRREGADAAAVDVVSPPDWDPQALSQRFDLIILDDIHELSEPQANAVEQFAYAGGGLLMAPGSRTNAENFNRMLYRSGGGVSPAGLGAAAPVEPRAAPLALDRAHPIFAAVDTAADALSPATVARAFRVSSRTSASRVIGGLASGEPLWIESTYGQGRVILMTTPLDAEWGAMPLTKFYLPFVQSAARYLISGALTEHNLVTGQEIVATFSDAPEPRRASIQRPDGSHAAIEPFAVGGRVEVRYAQTDQPGQYIVRAGGHKRADEAAQSFIVHAPADESDIRPLTAPRWKWLAESLRLRRMEVDDPNLAPARRGEGRTPDLWLAALAGVLALFVADLALSRAWSSRMS
jgi:hypothetical protein